MMWLADWNINSTSARTEAAQTSHVNLVKDRKEGATSQNLISAYILRIMTTIIIIIIIIMLRLRAK